jgi:hypothetical protein
MGRANDQLGHLSGNGRRNDPDSRTRCRELLELGCGNHPTANEQHLPVAQIQEERQ